MAFPLAVAGGVAQGLGFLGKAAGGLLGFFGQKKANDQNLQIAREQMAFQERMSNTAYTRATKDLEQAGLNRILALGSPASSPGGQTATMQSELGAAVDKQLSQMSMDLMREQVNKTRAETRFIDTKSDAIEPAGVIGDAVGSVLDRVIGGPQGANAKYSKSMNAAKAGATNLLEFLDLGGVKATSAYEVRRKRNQAHAEMKRARAEVLSAKLGSKHRAAAMARYEAAKRRYRSYGGKSPKEGNSDFRDDSLHINVYGKRPKR